MRQNNYRLIEKRVLDDTGKLWQLKFEAPGIDALPGQFVNILVDGCYLRRPISVSEYDGEVLTLIIDTVGEGTKRIVETEPGESLNLLTGLGNSFSLSLKEKGQVILIGGGVGYAPLVGLFKCLRDIPGLTPLAFFGFNNLSTLPQVHLDELRREYGDGIQIATMTGEYGFKGNALELAKSYIADKGITPALFYTCGPMPMMRAVCNAFDFDGQASLESRMGCGFGACMGCSIPTPSGPKRICKEGPVFRKSELGNFDF